MLVSCKPLIIFEKQIMNKLLFLIILNFYCLAGFSQIRILSLGESTTDFGPSYRRKMCELLTADGLNYDMVGPKNDGLNTYDGDHAGYSGVPSLGVQKQLQSFYSTHPADIILIWEGTNDCGWATVGGSITPLSDLVNKACELYPNAKVLVASIPPMGYHAYESVELKRLPGVAQANGVLYNNAIPGMCNAKFKDGKKVFYVNATSLTMADISNDGVHPNQTGYDNMGTIFYKALTAAITPVAINSVNLPAKASISNVGKIQLNTTILPASATNKSIIWLSSNNSIATINSSGLVTAVNVGNVNITAMAKNDTSKKAICALTVSLPKPVSTISLPKNATVNAGETVKIPAIVLPANALQNTNWLSANTAVATVNNAGIITGVNLGKVLITATSTTNSNKSAKCFVTVTQPPAKIEAENAILVGGVVKNTNHTGFSGTGFIDKFEVVGSSVSFNVYAKFAGKHNVTLRYCNNMGNTRSVSIYINGLKIRKTALINLTNWNTWADKTETLNLNLGSNTITYKYDESDNGFINIDFLSLSKIEIPKPKAKQYPKR